MGTELESGFMLAAWTVRPKLGTLSGPAGTARLEPKVMRVLVCLAEASGEVVTRDQFIEQVWDGRIVSDEVLSRCISILRGALGDDPREPRYIQTVPKIGYRLIAAVAPQVSAAPPQAPRVPAAPGGQPPASNEAQPSNVAASSPATGFRKAGLAAAALLIAAFAFVLWRSDGDEPDPPTAADRPSLVVLPFANLRPGRDEDYFSDGLTEELIDRLVRVSGLDVVASTSSFALKQRSGDVRTIAAELGVDFVLEGSVRRDGDRIRITAQLVDADRGFHLWSKRFDTTLVDLFAVQDAIADGIVDELGPRLSSAAQLPVRAQPTDVLPAYELLLRGRYHLKRRDEDSIRRSIELFLRAVELDPAFAEAWRELARAYVLLPAYSYEDPDAMYAEAVAVIERGAEVRPALRETASDVLGLVHLNRWEWGEAERAFRQALSASPNDPSVRQWYSQLLANVGNPHESLVHILEAKRLDVLSPVVNDRLAIAWMWVDDDRKARQQFELAAELGMGPSSSPEAQVLLLLREGNFDEARRRLIDLQKLFARAAGWIDPFIAAVADSAARPAAAAALARAARERQISLQYLFGAWVYLGDTDAAMDVAFELLHERTAFRAEFLFARETAALRCHPRFAELVSAIGLEAYWQEYGWPSIYARPGVVRGCS